MFPFLQLISNSQRSENHIVRQTNQYSILNRLKGKDILLNFSMDLGEKLPKLNRRLRQIQQKQNLIQLKKKAFQSDKRVVNGLSKQINQLKQYILMNQRNKLSSRQQSSCCCRKHNDCQQQMPYYPMPNMFPFNMQQNPFNMQQNSYQNQQSSKLSQQEQQKQKIKKQANSKAQQQNKKQKKKQLIKRFRKCAYAVYFSIFIKYFSIKFTKNRYSLFKDRYLKNDCQKVKQDSFKITKTIQVINLVKLFKKSPVSISNFSALDIKSTKKLKGNNQMPQLASQKFCKALNFINLYLQQLQKMIINDKFLQYYSQIISIGTINQSFFIDDLMIPQQIQLITFSQKKGFAQIGIQTQKVLIAIYIFIKHVLFKTLISFKQKNLVTDNWAKQQTKDKINCEIDQFQQFIELMTAIFYSLVNSMYLEYLQTHGANTNYHNLKKKFRIQAANILMTPDYQLNQDQQVDFQQLIVGIDKIQEINPFLQEPEFQEYLGYLVGEIQNFTQNLRKRVKEFNHIVYSNLKQITLGQEYIIFNGMQDEEKQTNKKSKNVSNTGGQTKKKDQYKTKHKNKTKNKQDSNNDMTSLQAETNSKFNRKKK